MLLPHLNFDNQFLVQKNVTLCILCGDPQRTQMIAQKYLKNSDLITDRRGFVCYTGETSLGKPILVATSGIGSPSTSIVVNELAQAGIKTIIRVGTTGSLNPQIPLESVIVNFASLCKQGAANDIAPPEYPAAASPVLTTSVYQHAKKIYDKVFYGINASVDTFYEGQERYQGANPSIMARQRGLIQEYQNLNILNFEMETGTIFKMANVYKLHAASICAVLATRYSSGSEGEELHTEAANAAIDICVRSALSALEDIQNGLLECF
jgi:uridine phosphorylase